MKGLFIRRVLILFLVLVFTGVSATPALAETIWSKPDAPTGLTTTEITFSTVTLAWVDNSLWESGFNIERSPDGITFTKIGSTANTTYKDSGLSPLTKYYYRIVAYNGFGSSYTNSLGVTTKPLIFLLPPAAPTGLTAATLSNSEIKIGWVDNSNNESLFKIERKGGTGLGAGIFVEIGTVAEGIKTYTDTGLSANTKYTYRVRAHNIMGDSGYSNEASSTTNFMILIPIAPLAPVNLTAIGPTSSRIDLLWEDKSNNETGFLIEKRSGMLPFVEVATVGANVVSYSDTGLAANTTYEYRVRASGAMFSSEYTNVASAKTKVLPTGITSIRLYIDSMGYFVDDVPFTMDVAPLLKDDRTLLPIKYIIEPLGGDVQWDQGPQKVTVNLGGKTIMLWVQNNKATVDGVVVPIDSTDPNVMPINVYPGRIMVPIRFVTEALGCDVIWVPSKPKEVTIIY